MDNAIQTWRTAAATAALAVAIIGIATAAGFAVSWAFNAVSGLHEARAFAAGEWEALFTARIATSLFAFQIVTVFAVLSIDAWRRHRKFAALLSFRMPVGGVRTLLLAVLALVALATCFASLVFLFDPEALRRDLQPFAEMMRSRTWWLILLAAGLGAPLAEELLFRGLIFGSLRPTAMGFAGATAISAVSWSLLHANYSVYGLIAITLIGFYLAWLRERTGSLLTPIVCHGAYNSLIILLMVLAPDGTLRAG